MTESKQEIVNYLKSAGFKEIDKGELGVLYLKEYQGGMSDSVMIKEGKKVDIVRIRDGAAAGLIKEVDSLKRFKYLYNKVKEAVVVLGS